MREMIHNLGLFERQRQVPSFNLAAEVTAELKCADAINSREAKRSLDMLHVLG